MSDLTLWWGRDYLSNGYGRPRTRAIREDWSVTYQTEEGSRESTVDAKSRAQALEQVDSQIADLQGLRQDIVAHPGPGPVPEYLEEWVGEEQT